MKSEKNTNEKYNKLRFQYNVKSRVVKIAVQEYLQTLKLGLNFEITPNKILIHEIIAGTEDTARQLDKKSGNKFRYEVSNIINEAPKVEQVPCRELSLCEATKQTKLSLPFDLAENLFYLIP